MLHIHVLKNSALHKHFQQTVLVDKHLHALVSHESN